MFHKKIMTSFFIALISRHKESKVAYVCCTYFQLQDYLPYTCRLTPTFSSVEETKLILRIYPYLTGNTLCLCYEPNRLMLSIGLWRWHIHIIIKIPDIIHRPVFYLKLNPTLYVCSYLTENKSRLRYEPNRLILSIVLRRRYINKTIKIPHINHRPVFYLKHDVSETAFCFLLQVEPIRLSPAVYETSYFK
jgi:hypothetical protein